MLPSHSFLDFPKLSFSRKCKTDIKYFCHWRKRMVRSHQEAWVLIHTHEQGGIKSPNLRTATLLTCLQPSLLVHVGKSREALGWLTGTMAQVHHVYDCVLAVVTRSDYGGSFLSKWDSAQSFSRCCCKGISQSHTWVRTGCELVLLQCGA